MNKENKSTASVTENKSNIDFYDVGNYTASLLLTACVEREKQLQKRYNSANPLVEYKDKLKEGAK